MNPPAVPDFPATYTQAERLAWLTGMKLGLALAKEIYSPVLTLVPRNPERVVAAPAPADAHDPTPQLAALPGGVS